MLDEHERRALSQFLRLLDEEGLDPKPEVDRAHILRGPEGQIYVPVVLDTAEPSVNLALHMAHKAEHVYKQTGSRFVIAQRLKHDPKAQYHIWLDGAWKPLH